MGPDKCGDRMSNEEKGMKTWGQEDININGQKDKRPVGEEYKLTGGLGTGGQEDKWT